jgi:hypothetical protein
VERERENEAEYLCIDCECREAIGCVGACAGMLISERRRRLRSGMHSKRLEGEDEWREGMRVFWDET